MTKREPKTVPIENAEGFYVTTMLPNPSDPRITHLKFSMPLYMYVQVPDELVEDKQYMALLEEHVIDNLIHNIEETIKKFRKKTKPTKEVEKKDPSAVLYAEYKAGRLTRTEWADFLIYQYETGDKSK